MEKRMMALLLSVFLACNTSVGALCEAGGVSAWTQENGAALQAEEGDKDNNSGSQKPGEGDSEGGEAPGQGAEPGNPGGAADKPEMGEDPADKPEGGSPVEDPGDGGGSEQVQAEHTITFDFNGGTVSGASPTAKVKDGENLNSIVPPVPVRTGYKFQYWLDASGRKYDTAQPIYGDITLVAYWQPITYKIRFELGGGAGSMPDQTFTYDEEKSIFPNAFTRGGHVFVEWEWRGTSLKYQDKAVVKNLTSQDGQVLKFRAKWTKVKYKVRFDANGGTGQMDLQEHTFFQQKALSSNKYKRAGYTFDGWNTKKDGTGISYKNKEKVTSMTDVHGSTVVLYAMWKGIPYKVKYDGNGATSGSMADSSHVYGTLSSLNKNKFKKKGCSFKGWNTKKDGKGVTYKDGASIKDLTTKKNQAITLYAQWTTAKYKITYKKNGGKLASSAKKTYTIDSNFTLPRPTRKGYDFDGWYKTSKFKKRIGEITKGSTGNLTLYAKWVKCTQKPKSDSAKLTSCKATGTGKISVKATVKKRVASSDDYYYLMYLNPFNKRTLKVAAKAYKKKSITYTLKTTENPGYAVSMYGIAVKKSGKYQLISNGSYVGNVEKAASNKAKYNPGSTKKGIQFQNSMDEIYACGAKQNFLNVTASMVLNNATVPYYYNGKTYYFNAMESYQNIVMDCNKNGITVTMQIMLDWVEGHADLIDPKARAAGAAPFYSWFVTNSEVRQKMEAMFSYLGMVFGKKNCYTSNWILGNEVNNPAMWHYKGSMSTGEYFKSYTYAFRALYHAVKSQQANANIFICTDNLWNTSPSGGYSAWQVINSFTSKLNSMQPGLKWNLAYHAYSFPLTYTKFWDGYGVTDEIHSPYITMKNIGVLTNYIKKTYGRSVRIILSEQGYSSTWGQSTQAAALAYSYYIAACNPMIDAFIIRSYLDHPVEVAQGLSMGIAGKEAFDVYKYMDTTSSNAYTNRYLGMLGGSVWESLVPEYHLSRIIKMYRKT